MLTFKVPRFVLLALVVWPTDPAATATEDPLPVTSGATREVGPLESRPTLEPPPSLEPWQAPSSSADVYAPITAAQRIRWIVEGTVGPRSLAAGVAGSSWQAGFNLPEEWGRTWTGFGKRYLEREADVAISNTIEAGVGALWGEDPRYISSGRHGIWPRAGYAIKTAFLAPRRDGRLAPAWGRYAGNVFNNLIENTWLPPSATTRSQTTVRSLEGLGSRILENLWGEFWPDVRKRLRK